MIADVAPVAALVFRLREASRISAGILRCFEIVICCVNAVNGSTRILRVLCGSLSGR